MFVVGAILPPVGEVGDSCVKHGRRDVGGEGSVVEDAWFKPSIGVGTGQRMKGVILIPSSVPVKLFKFCQIFGEIGHPLMGIAEALDFSS